MGGCGCEGEGEGVMYDVLYVCLCEYVCTCVYTVRMCILKIRMLVSISIVQCVRLIASNVYP